MPLIPFIFDISSLYPRAAPAITSECPPINLVAEYNTMSTFWSRGDWNIGPINVLSTITFTLFPSFLSLSLIFTIPSKSTMTLLGFAGVSIYKITDLPFNLDLIGLIFSSISLIESDPAFT